MKYWYVLAALVLATHLVPSRGLAEPASQAASEPYYSTSKSQLGELVDNPVTKAIVACYLPEVINNAHVAQARHLTLKDMQPLAPKIITDEKLAMIDAELAKVPPPSRAPMN